MSTLAEQPPPRRGAKAGYYPDPLGSGRARYWDGMSWTATIGHRIPPDAPRGKRVPPPIKVCPHCGTQAETFGASCPNCGKSYQRNLWVIPTAVGVVLLVLFLGGCIALIAAVDEADFEDEEISKTEFDSIRVGASEGAVRSELGRPAETSEIEQRRRIFRCLYYDDEGFDTEDYYELCFAEGRLFSKREFH